MKKRLSALLLFIIVLTLFVTACSQPQNSADITEGITITDCAGREVACPLNPASVAVLDPLAAQAVIMFGQGDKMSSTVGGVIRDKLLQDMYPPLADCPNVKSSGAANAEELLKLGTDLILIKSDMYNSENERQKIESLNIPYLVIDYNTIDSQLQSVRIVGTALGCQQQAEDYCAYYLNTIERVSALCADIPQEELPRLYHSINPATRTDNAGSVTAEWIAVTRAVNVSVGEQLNYNDGDYYASLEQIMIWDPDLIICNESGVDQYILSDPKWQGLAAVRTGKVYQMPIGVSRYGHPNSIETPLAILWLADLLYGDKLSEPIDFRAEMKSFYTTFYNYQADEETIDAILSGQGIRAASTDNPGEGKKNSN